MVTQPAGTLGAGVAARALWAQPWLWPCGYAQYQLEAKCTWIAIYHQLAVVVDAADQIIIYLTKGCLT